MHLGVCCVCVCIWVCVVCVCVCVCVGLTWSKPSFFIQPWTVWSVSGLGCMLISRRETERGITLRERNAVSRCDAVMCTNL